MKWVSFATCSILATMMVPVQAADLDQEMGLIVSGVVDNWAGVQFVDDGLTDDSVFASGGQGLLSLPLADNLSIQSDIKYQYNSTAFENPGSAGTINHRYSYQGAVHLSFRDPSTGLIGAFGGMGTSNLGGTELNGLGALNDSARTNAHFVGGEAQVYLENITLYAQGGFVDFNSDDNDGLSDGAFVRGVFRWFVTPDSRVQLEAQYTNADYFFDFQGDVEAFSVGGRYDFTLGDVPLIGDTALFVAYQGTFRDNCIYEADADDHTIMIGAAYSFSGDLLTVDRRGATLDTPSFFSCLAED
jgi:hypothetical protein